MASVFSRLNESLISIGKKIGKVTNPIILTIFYALLIGSTWLFVRLAGIRPLELGIRKGSTWDPVDNPRQDKNSLQRQW